MEKIKTYVHDGGRIGDGFTNEKLDCAVRAYAIAYEMPYSDAHDLFEKMGRQSRHRTSWDIYNKLGMWFTNASISLKEFIKNFPEGTFYVCKRGHAFVVKNGVAFDAEAVSGRVKIKKYFRVK